VTFSSGSAERSAGRTILAVILALIALVFIVVAAIYIIEPANSLPSFVPGRSAHSAGHHPLRVVGSFVIGIIFAVGAWFALSYKPRPPATPLNNNQESSPASRS
jgi:amino acid permease